MRRVRTLARIKRSDGVQQPVIVEIEAVMAMFGQTSQVVKEWVKQGLLPTLGKRRKGQWYRFSYPMLLEFCDDDEWLSRAQEIKNQLWARKNAARRRREKTRASQGAASAQQITVQPALATLERPK